MSRIKVKAGKLLEKSRDSALLAVEIYNKPRTAFRSNGYIVLMSIAWTSLLHAIFEKRGISYFYKKNKVRYQMIDGERRSWDLAESTKKYFTDQNSPERKNLEFFVKLRNKIEHRFVPEIDKDIFGECQAMLINYEDTITKEFGDNFAVSENLVFALQFSKILHSKQNDIVKSKQGKEYREVKKFINQYRGSLKKEVVESMNYNFRVYLIPKVGNHKNSSDFTLEFVKYNPANPLESEKYQKLLVGIKEKQVPYEGFKAGAVAKAVYEKLKDKMPLNWKFNPSSKHVRCWKYYKVRPETGSKTPENTKIEYCFWDKTFGQYGFTQKWIDFLVKELQDKDKYKKIMTTR